MQLLIRDFDRFYRLSFGKRPAEELYDIRKDPDCVVNLMETEAGRDRSAELAARMETLLRAEGDPRMLGRGWVFNTYQYVGNRKHAFGTWLEHNGAGDADRVSADD
jgi:hypothetical protein